MYTCVCILVEAQGSYHGSFLIALQPYSFEAKSLNPRAHRRSLASHLALNILPPSIFQDWHYRQSTKATWHLCSLWGSESQSACFPRKCFILSHLPNPARCVLTQSLNTGCHIAARSSEWPPCESNVWPQHQHHAYRVDHGFFQPWSTGNSIQLSTPTDNCPKIWLVFLLLRWFQTSLYFPIFIFPLASLFIPAFKPFYINTAYEHLYNTSNHLKTLIVSKSPQSKRWSNRLFACFISLMWAFFWA